MNTLLLFISRISIILYALAATGIFFAFRGIVLAQHQRRVALFGLEREAAQARFRRSLSIILILAFLAGVVYVVDNVVVPNMTVAEEEPEEEQPVAFIEPQPTPTERPLLFPTITPTAGVHPAEGDEEEASSDTAAQDVVGCEIVGSTITSPVPGQRVSGQVSVEGEANVLNFSQYKFEVRGPSTDNQWVVVGTYFQTVPQGLLGVWDSTSLLPGDYTLRLIIHRQDGSTIPPCEVPIIIERPGTIIVPQEESPTS